MLRKRVYFDTNVFDHLYKRLGIADASFEILFSAVRGKRISILLSVLNIEEILCALESDSALAVGQMRYVLELSDWHRILKPPAVLLGDDISGYANSEPPEGPFIDDAQLLRTLAALMNPREQDLEELLKVATQTRKQIHDFSDAMNQARDNILPVVARLKGKHPSFQEYQERLSGSFAEGLAERLGVLDLCRQRGIAGLLEIRSVRLSVGGMLSLAYAQAFEGRTPDPGDSRDLLHLVGAAVADVFVTNDRKFARLVSRISLDDFEVHTLSNFLDSIR